MKIKAVRDDTAAPPAIVALLKACAQNKDLNRGRELHADVARSGLLQQNGFVGNAVVNVYAKCGALATACEVFDNLPRPDVVSWNILIAGYAQHGHGQEALFCFKRMKHEGFYPNTLTFLSVLKALVSIGPSGQAELIHAEIANDGLLKRDIIIGNAVIDMYAKCGSLSKAQDVFDELPIRNVVSWNALTAGYVQYGNGEAVLNCFEHMQLEGLSPDHVTFLCSLKACSILGALDTGQWIHAEIARKGLLRTEIEVYNAMIDMYAKCGEVSIAQEVFDTLEFRNITSWNSLIAGYTHQGYGKEALMSYGLMLHAGLIPNSITFVCILKACISTGLAYQGQSIHAHVVKLGLLERDSVIGTTLIDMYSKCGEIQAAQELFDKLLFRTRTSWNVLIAGYLNCDESGRALSCSEHMRRDGHSPDTVTFLFILKACGNLGEASKGEQIHAEIDKVDLPEKDYVMVANGLVDMYVKCGVLEKAEEVFDKIPVKTLVSWNVMIAGYVNRGLSREALNCFKRMQFQGILPDDVTFVYILKACGGVGALEKGQEIHDWIMREDLLEKDSVVATALVNMYLDFGMLSEAQIVSDMSVHDAVSWNALISGYAHHLHGDRALQCYEQMKKEGFSPNAVTFLSTLKACESIGAAHKGQKIHAEIARIESLERGTLIGTALIEMYASFGMLRNAQEVFDGLLVQDGIARAALLAGYGQLGDDRSVLNLLRKMVSGGEEPDLVIFMAVLNTCTHMGLLDEGQIFFQTMISVHGIIPTLEHHTCMVDLFGRAGALDKAIAIIEDMPFPTNCMVWHNMLGACQKHGNVKIGRLAFEHAIQLDEMDVLAFVSMRNICAAASRHNNGIKVEPLTMADMDMHADVVPTVQYL